MKDHIKTPEEIAGIRIAAQIAASTLEMIGEYVKPGVTTGELDRLCHEFITSQNAVPTSLGYDGFPKSICTSVNHVVCHGIPGDKKLKNGDIINIDIGVTKDGFIGDTSKMYYVGKPSILARRLTETCYHAMMAGIRAVRPGVDVSEIGRAIEAFIKKHAPTYSIVRNYCGHGVGIEYHEELQILHFAYQDLGIALQPGMVFTIEPMINAGSFETKQMPDGWTVVTKDHNLSAQWEHTILVTETGSEILSVRKDEEIQKWVYFR